MVIVRVSFSFLFVEVVFGFAVWYFIGICVVVRVVVRWMIGMSVFRERVICETWYMIYNNVIGRVSGENGRAGKRRK